MQKALDKVYAHLSCSDLNRSIDWYGKLFDRKPDARPMGGLAEWHHGKNAGFQLFEEPSNAGYGTLTLIVTGLREEHIRLGAVGLEPSDVELADTVSLIRLRDPDGNLVVLAQPGRA
jgi:catechol 2,3-dioxygenase-like lactoylglutathione lyase family enzyme